MKIKLVIFLSFIFSFYSLHADENVPEEGQVFKKEFNSLVFSLSSSLKEIEKLPTKDIQNTITTYKHIIKSISEEGRVLALESEWVYSINWWDRGTSKKWKKGDQIYVIWENLSQQYRLEHTLSKESVWASDEKRPLILPTIQVLPNGVTDPDAHSKVILSDGYVFRSRVDGAFGKSRWKVKDRIAVFANPGGLFYQLWNLDKESIIQCKFVQYRNNNTKVQINFEDILGLEERLNQNVLQQSEATKAVAASLLIYSAGFKEKERPIGVFLFLGPTGVGKTELAKVLTKELYKDVSSLLRFDMSHFNEGHTSSRLIGSPPGYVNHEEGGQLTEPLLKNPHMVVLLDEMEKAHPQVLKMFLPIFDEGFVLDSRNTRVDCSNVIFIMTSNLCGPEIARLYSLGYSDDDILSEIEQKLMEKLSPELYNRVEPVLFRPLEQSTMEALVDLTLNQLVKRIFREKQIRLTIDDSLKSFLIENGYHPLLGARPLKKLIEKRVVAALAFRIIKDNIDNGTAITLMYDHENDSVLVITE
jgi:hypothetical protein